MAHLFDFLDSPELLHGKEYWSTQRSPEYLIRVWAEFYVHQIGSRPHMRNDLGIRVEEYYPAHNDKTLINYLNGSTPNDVSWQATLTSRVTATLLHRWRYRRAMHWTLFETAKRYGGSYVLLGDS